jgi:hypothetical protein
VLLKILSIRKGIYEEKNLKSIAFPRNISGNLASTWYG